uniref:Uncharacterized protein n=1 Tax=Oryza sativa subsp. japonica TaxID=39947 RepID=Q6K4Z4_ORYSJ|nr:unknown protein [Oryza sativa Japonica Group]BAD19810.1 unknown protein [Oryza sativa Japonica Group]
MPIFVYLGNLRVAARMSSEGRILQRPAEPDTSSILLLLCTYDCRLTLYTSPFSFVWQQSAAVLYAPWHYGYPQLKARYSLGSDPIRQACMLTLILSG